MKIAIIDKAPSRNNYSKYFEFEFELFHMSSVPITKLLKKDVDLEIDLKYYDLVILVGSEAAKEYAKVTSVTNFAGQLVNDRFVCIINPAMLIFKPEGKPDFERSIAKIKELAENGVTSNKIIGDFGGIDNKKDALAYLLEVLYSDVPCVAMDTETSALYVRDGYVIGISLSYKVKQGRYILTDILDEECLEVLQAIVDKYDIIFHNMKFDIKMIHYHLGIIFRPDHVHDTMVLHYSLDENAMHGLKVLALKYTDYGDYDSALEEFKKSYCAEHGIYLDDFTYDLIPFEIMWPYASMDTGVTLELYFKFKTIVDNNTKLSFVYTKLLIPGTLFLNDMEEVGIPISSKRMKAASEYLNERIAAAKAHLYTFPEVHKFEADQGAEFNPNSVVQLRKLLFDYLGLTPTGKLTKMGAISTNAEVLEELSKEHAIPKAILDIRQLGKMRNTYVVKILPELDRDERIRTNFNLIFTTSGRLSSSGKFNAQQIPRDDPIIKGCIVAPVGYKIVSQDLQTGEMYYAAVLSGDKNLQKVFLSGGDFHSTIAKMVFDLPGAVDDVKDANGNIVEYGIKKRFPAMRQSAKAISFGILYGSGPQKVSDTVSEATGEHYGIDRAKEDIEAYFKKFSRLKKWLNERKAFIEVNGYTYSFFGRKRRLPNVFSSDKGIAAHEVRSGINSEVQSICSDVNLLGAIDTANNIRHLDAKIFMLVHDSIVALVKEEHVEEYCQILRQYTQLDRGCSISGCPIGIDQDIGDDYSFGKFDEYYKLEGDKLSRI
jgi:DNA polymerase I-like protein with 3'-5' exonuclease and polymerase domains